MEWKIETVAIVLVRASTVGNKCRNTNETGIETITYVWDSSSATNYDKKL